MTLINFVFHPLQGGKYNRTSVMRYLTTLMHLITRQCTYLETSCQDLEIDGDVEFLILASDGLWDVVVCHIPNLVHISALFLLE